jgi:hypothetical protein
LTNQEEKAAQAFMTEVVASAMEAALSPLTLDERRSERTFLIAMLGRLASQLIVRQTQLRDCEGGNREEASYTRGADAGNDRVSAMPPTDAGRGES